MTTQRSQRGFTLIESMAALGVMLIGTVGVAGIFKIGVTMNGDAQRLTRATAIAEDLLGTIALWPYQDDVAGTPLANASPANDADVGDTAFRFQISSDPIADGLADHGAADVAAMGAAWTGLSAADVAGYERYWNVSYVDTNGNGVNDVVQIAAVVRWQQGGGWRRVVLLSAKVNPDPNR